MGKSYRHSNLEWWRSNEERKRSSVAQPHRNKKKYHRPSQKRIPRNDDE